MLKRTIKILSELVAFACLGGKSNLPIAHYIEKVFQEHNISYYQVPNKSGNKKSLHCRIGKVRDNGLILSGHTDVVPTEGQTWTKPPFTLTQEGDKLFGRGTTDMKGFIACCLAMLPEMQKVTLEKPIYLAFSYDEEVVCLGAPDLIQSITENYQKKPSFAIIGEPTSMKTVTGEKGMGAFTTTVYSSAGHSALVHKNVSAIEEATCLIQWLMGKKIALKKEIKARNQFDPPYTSIHVGTIKGGTAVNINADHCSFEWDVRNIPTDNISGILSDYENFCQERISIKRVISSEFNIKTVANFPIVPGLNTSNNSDFVKTINQFNGTEQPDTVSFASEAGQYAEGGYEAILCGPGNINRAHKADEYIKISELDTCLDFLMKLIEWCRKE